MEHRPGALHFRQNVLDLRRPGERPGVTVVVCDERLNGCDEVGDALEHLSSANTPAPSRCAPFETVLVVEATEDRSRHDPRVTRETMASDRGHGRLERWLQKARAEARARAAAMSRVGYPMIVRNLPALSAKIISSPWIRNVPAHSMAKRSGVSVIANGNRVPAAASGRARLSSASSTQVSPVAVEKKTNRCNETTQASSAVARAMM